MALRKFSCATSWTFSFFSLSSHERCGYREYLSFEVGISFRKFYQQLLNYHETADKNDESMTGREVKINNSVADLMQFIFRQ